MPARLYRHPLLLVVLSVLATLLLCGVVGLVWLKEQSPTRYEALLRAARQAPRVLKRSLRALPTEVPVLQLHIKHLHIQDLEYQRQLALQSRHHQAFEYVPAQFNWKGQRLKAKIRLKGDRLIHFQGEDQWSFRVHLRDGQLLAGMRSFSLHKSGARNHLYEWVFHEMLRREGFIALKYEFLRLYVNGVDWGIYALEEHFDKLLVERYGYREGPIVRLDESLGESDLHKSVARPFKAAKWTTADKLPLVQQAVDLLEGFRRGHLKVSEVFDTEKMATFFALNDLMGTHHASVWKSLRFYYNPITSRLEPIGFDGHLDTHKGLGNRMFLAAEASTSEQTGWWYKLFDDWFHLLFAYEGSFDEQFFRAYIQALGRISAPAYLHGFFDSVQQELEQKLDVLYQQPFPGADHLAYYGPDVYEFSTLPYEQQQQYIREVLTDSTNTLRVYRGELQQGRISLQVGHVGTLPVEILWLELDSLRLLPDTPALVLPAMQQEATHSVPRYGTYSFRLPAGLQWHDSLWRELRVLHRIPATGLNRRAEVFPWRQYASERRLADLLRQPPNAHTFEWLHIDEAAGLIRLPAGRHVLRRPLIIPAGYHFVASPGVELQLGGQGMVISYAPLKWQGTAEAPVKVSALDSTAAGMLVLSRQPSVLRQVKFEGLGPPARGNWALTGAVTFYETRVALVEVEFAACRGEDALNLVRSDFMLEACHFSRSEGDALDIDFGQGEIVNTDFAHCGNDAIDVAGAGVKLRHIQIVGAADKALSAGEQARVEGEHILVAQSAIGLTAKDLASLHLRRVLLRECELGLAVYQKKAEFGGGNMVLEEFEAQKSGRRALVEKASVLQLNGIVQPAEDEAVASLLYGNKYGKSSDE